MTRVLFLSFFLLGICAAQGNSFTNSTKSSVVSASESYVQTCLNLWQARLGLSDWKVSVSVVRSTELKPKTLGNIHWDVSKKSARIRVLSPEDYDPSVKNILDDMEETVVHELVHVILVPFQPENGKTDEERGTEEVVVSGITHAFLALDRVTK